MGYTYTSSDCWWDRPRICMMSSTQSNRRVSSSPPSLAVCCAIQSITIQPRAERCRSLYLAPTSGANNDYYYSSSGSIPVWMGGMMIGVSSDAKTKWFSIQVERRLHHHQQQWGRVLYLDPRGAAAISRNTLLPPSTLAPPLRVNMIPCGGNSLWSQLHTTHNNILIPETTADVRSTLSVTDAKIHDNFDPEPLLWWGCCLVVPPPFHYRVPLDIITAHYYSWNLKRNNRKIRSGSKWQIFEK